MGQGRGGWNQGLGSCPVTSVHHGHIVPLTLHVRTIRCLRAECFLIYVLLES